MTEKYPNTTNLLLALLLSYLGTSLVLFDLRIWEWGNFSRGMMLLAALITTAMAHTTPNQDTPNES